MPRRHEATRFTKQLRLCELFLPSRQIEMHPLNMARTADLPLHYGRVPPWLAQRIEKDFEPRPFFDEIVQKKRDESYAYGRMTVFGNAQPLKKKGPVQLKLL